MRVCAGVCAQVFACVYVFAGVRGDAQVCAGVHGCGSVQKGGCAGVHGCVHVCGMNFQNFFWRIESLHQRTLIRILYEFYSIENPSSDSAISTTIITLSYQNDVFSMETDL